MMNKMMKVEKAVVTLGGADARRFKAMVSEHTFTNPKTKEEITFYSIFFSKEEGMRVIKEMKEVDCFGKYDEENDEFIFCTIPYEGNHEEDEYFTENFFEYYELRKVEFEGKEIEVYQIGEGNWDWIIEEKEVK